MPAALRAGMSVVLVPTGQAETSPAPKTPLAQFAESLQLYDFVHSIGNASLPLGFIPSGTSGKMERVLCKLPGKSSPLSWSKTIG